VELNSATGCLVWLNSATGCRVELNSATGGLGGADPVADCVKPPFVNGGAQA